jgi:ribonuclease D
MNLITDSESLKSFCDELSEDNFITIDTEFLRDKRYYPELCLVQIAGEKTNAVIDALSPDIDIKILSVIFDNENIRKVFHSARQDLEIILNIFGCFPKNLYDTQVAAMVCGFGASVSYAKLVETICDVTIDKSSRFSNWSRRPLNNKQLHYAISDVTYLRDVYDFLSSKIVKNNRLEWIADEMSSLSDIKIYQPNYDNLWKKIANRGMNRKFLAVLKELAIAREKLAQKHNLARSYVIGDNVLCEIASIESLDMESIESVKAIKSFKKSWLFEILDAVNKANNLSKDEFPEFEPYNKKDKSKKNILELLKVLLKIKAEQNEVAERLICSSQDLKEIARNDALSHNLQHSWRYDVFGQDALKIIRGEAGIGVKNNKLMLINSNN